MGTYIDDDFHNLMRVWAITAENLFAANLEAVECFFEEAKKHAQDKTMWPSDQHRVIVDEAARYGQLLSEWYRPEFAKRVLDQQRTIIDARDKLDER
jgi:hypothetical protein